MKRVSHTSEPYLFVLHIEETPLLLNAQGVHDLFGSWGLGPWVTIAFGSGLYSIIWNRLEANLEL